MYERHFDGWDKPILITNKDYKTLLERFNPDNAVHTKYGLRWKISVPCPLCEKYLVRNIDKGYCYKCPLNIHPISVWSDPNGNKTYGCNFVLGLVAEDYGMGEAWLSLQMSGDDVWWHKGADEEVRELLKVFLEELKHFWKVKR